MSGTVSRHQRCIAASRRSSSSWLRCGTPTDLVDDDSIPCTPEHDEWLARIVRRTGICPSIEAINTDIMRAVAHGRGKDRQATRPGHGRGAGCPFRVDRAADRSRRRAPGRWVTARRHIRPGHTASCRRPRPRSVGASRPAPVRGRADADEVERRRRSPSSSLRSPTARRLTTQITCWRKPCGGRGRSTAGLSKGSGCANGGHRSMISVCTLIDSPTARSARLGSVYAYSESDWPICAS